MVDQPLVISPILSSAKRSFKIGMFDIFDMIAMLGWFVLGHYVVPITIYIGMLFFLVLLIAFFKHNKPDGYLIHYLRFLIRGRFFKPTHIPTTPVYFKPEDIEFEKLPDKKTMEREMIETENFLTKLKLNRLTKK
jgi:hypothetical protein